MPSQKRKDQPAPSDNYFYNLVAYLISIVIAFFIMFKFGGKEYYQSHLSLGWGSYILFGLAALSIGAVGAIRRPERPNGFLILIFGIFLLILYPLIWDGNVLIFLGVALLFAIPAGIGLFDRTPSPIK